MHTLLLTSAVRIHRGHAYKCILYALHDCLPVLMSLILFNGWILIFKLHADKSKKYIYIFSACLEIYLISHRWSQTAETERFFPVSAPSVGFSLHKPLGLSNNCCWCVWMKISVLTGSKILSQQITAGNSIISLSMWF